MRRGTFDELVSQACGSTPAPPQIAEWVADKFGPITKAHEKELEGRKRKHEPTHQLELETQGHTIRVLINGSDVTYVGVRKKTEVGSDKLQDLLRLISPDVSRDDWLRVGNCRRTYINYIYSYHRYRFSSL